MVQYKTGSDMKGSSFLTTPGKYHMIIEAAEIPVMKDGCESIKDFMAITFGVVGGPAGTKGKSKRLTWKKPEHVNNSDWATKKIDRALLAFGVISPDDTDADVNFEPEELIGRQCLMELELDEEKQKYLNISFYNIFHVDDAEAGSDYPRNEKALAQIPANLRRTGNSAPPKKNDVTSDPGLLI